MRAVQLAEAMKGMSHKPKRPTPFASDAEAATAGLANMTAFVPGIGDAAGLLADAVMYRDNPKQRTLRNMGLTALGVLPFVPALASMGKATRNVPSGMGNQVGAITYHGSPHRINNVTPDAPYGKFDLSKVGTGEGAQAYGHGVYLAENPNVARQYRDSFAIRNDAAVDLKSGESLAVPAWVQQRMDAGEVDSVIDDFSERLRQMQDYKAESLQPWLVDSQMQSAERILKAAQEFKAGKASTVPAAHFYTVDLPDEHIEKMLDWDAPLSQQPGLVDAAKKFLAENPLDKEFMRAAGVQTPDQAAALLLSDLSGKRASYLYFSLADAIGGKPDQVSKYLAKQGIPGIKYFDGGSRAAGQGTRNFVIFDGDTAKILKRE